MSSRRVLLQIGRGARAYSDVNKKAQEAAQATSQFAKETSEALGSKMTQAQRLAQATFQELVKDTPLSGGLKSGAASAKPEPFQEEPASSSAGSEQAQGSSGASQKEQQREARSAPSSSLAQRLGSFASAALREMRAAVGPEAVSSSALRGASAKASDIETATTSEVAVVREAPEAEAAWERAWRAANESLGSHPLFRRLRGAGSSLASSRVARAGRDVAEGLRERWDTSDSPLVHRIQDATDSFFAEGEQALALRKVMARDPGFDTARFLGQVKADVPEIIVAYLQGQEDVIRQHCTPEMTERLTGIMAATRAAGQIPDPTLLDTSDVELVDLKLLDDQPIVVVQFTCQQINCARDAHGNVVDGAPDDVHRVYYYWALQQEEQGYRGADGRVHPPRWQLREMLIRGMHHLL